MEETNQTRMEAVVARLCSAFQGIELSRINFQDGKVMLRSQEDTFNLIIPKDTSGPQETVVHLWCGAAIPLKPICQIGVFFRADVLAESVCEVLSKISSVGFEWRFVGAYFDYQGKYYTGKDAISAYKKRCIDASILGFLDNKVIDKELYDKMMRRVDAIGPEIHWR